MKIIKTATAMAVAMSATSALAGSVAPVTVDATRAVQEEPMRSGSGAWILPLLLLGVVAVAISNGGGESPPSPPSPPPAPPTPF